jgi:hypothetical protein
MDPTEATGSNGWKDVFSGCSALVNGEGVKGFDVQADTWSIHYTRFRRDLGKIHIMVRDLSLYPGLAEGHSQVRFGPDFHGEIDPRMRVLPDSDFSTFELTKQKLRAEGHGQEGWINRNSEGGSREDWPTLNQINTLEITREQQTEQKAHGSETGEIRPCRIRDPYPVSALFYAAGFVDRTPRRLKKTVG